MVRVTKPQIVTPEASKGSKRRRTAQLAGNREIVSGGQEVAQAEMSSEGRANFLLQPEFCTTADALAMKASLSLHWNKLRIMSR